MTPAHFDDLLGKNNALAERIFWRTLRRGGVLAFFLATLWLTGVPTQVIPRVLYWASLFSWFAVGYYLWQSWKIRRMALRHNEAIRHFLRTGHSGQLEAIHHEIKRVMS